MVDSESVLASIRFKLLLLTVVPTMLAVLVVGGVLTHCQTARLEASLREKASRYGELSSVQLRSAIAFDDRETARETLNGIVRDGDVVAVHLFNEARELLHSYGRAMPEGIVEGAPPIRADGTIAIVMPIRSLEGPRGSIAIAISTSSLASERSRIIGITVVVAIVAALFAFAIAFPISRSMSKRIQAVARYATVIASGDLETKPIDERGRDEVAQTANAVNTMVAQLQHLMAQQAERAADQQRLVLDHVNQGLFAVTYEGVLVGERSKATESMLGPIEATTIADIVRRHDEVSAAGFEVGFAQLASDILPVELALFQLPRELEARGRILAFQYTPFTDPAGSTSQRLLVTVTDITEEREHAVARDIEAESTAFLRQLASDRHGVRRFVEDARGQIELIGSAKSTTDVFAALHTLKGNAGLMGLDAWVKRCHEAETLLSENGDLTTDQRQELVWAWSATEDRVLPFLEKQTSIDMSTADFEALVRIAHREGSWAELRNMLRDITQESTAMPLRKLADHVRELATRHERPLGRLIVEDHGVRLDPDRWGPLWSVLTHVVRNVVVHGMQPGAPTNIALRTTRDSDGVTIEIADEGRGIQWDSLRERARAAGMACETREDLIAAMFAPQISTRDVVDETAGRGVGLAAVAATCAELGASFELPTQPRGTAFRFHLPTTPSRMSLTTIERENSCVATS